MPFPHNAVLAKVKAAVEVLCVRCTRSPAAKDLAVSIATLHRLSSLGQCRRFTAKRHCLRVSSAGVRARPLKTTLLLSGKLDQIETHVCMANRGVGSRSQLMQLREAATAAEAGRLGILAAQGAIATATASLRSHGIESSDTLRVASLRCLQAIAGSAGAGGALAGVAPDLASALPHIVPCLGSAGTAEAATNMLRTYTHAVSSVTGALGILCKFGLAPTASVSCREPCGMARTPQTPPALAPHTSVSALLLQEGVQIGALQACAALLREAGGKQVDTRALVQALTPCMQSEDDDVAFEAGKVSCPVCTALGSD